MRTSLAFEEALPRPEPEPQEEHPLADRLHACARLLEVAADELAAMERGDAIKRRELAELRDELVREIHPPTLGDREPEDEEDRGPTADELLLLLPQEVAKLLAEVLYELEEREEEERRMHDRWSSLEEDALRAMHVGGRIVSLRAGRYPEKPRHESGLDLRF